MVSYYRRYTGSLCFCPQIKNINKKYNYKNLTYMIHYQVHRLTAGLLVSIFFYIGTTSCSEDPELPSTVTTDVKYFPSSLLYPEITNTTCNGV